MSLNLKNVVGESLIVSECLSFFAMVILFALISNNYVIKLYGSFNFCAIGLIIAAFGAALCLLLKESFPILVLG